MWQLWKGHSLHEERVLVLDASRYTYLKNYDRHPTGNPFVHLSPEDRTSKAESETATWHPKGASIYIRKCAGFHLHASSIDQHTLSIHPLSLSSTMASEESSWMPLTGRHPVALGSSLTRALKARKGAPAAKRAALFDKDFYSFRCSSLVSVCVAKASSEMQILNRARRQLQARIDRLEPAGDDQREAEQ